LAAQLFKNERVMAIGWPYIDILGKSPKEIKDQLREVFRDRGEGYIRRAASSLVRFRDTQRGDIVLAYLGDNRVAMIGEVVDGRCHYNKNNDVGKPEEDGGKIDYAHQKRVKWWSSPISFSRNKLPKSLQKWVAIPGTIHVKEINLTVDELRKQLEGVESEELSPAFEIKDEDEIKDYMEAHLGELDPSGMDLIEREHAFSGAGSGTVDFLAKDGEGKPTLIEVKVRAKAKDIGQLLRYRGAYKRETEVKQMRSILVASSFTPGCKDAALEAEVELVKCTKKFVFEPVD